MSKKKTKQENATILTKKRKTYSWLEDTPWVDSKEELDLTLRHDTGSLITQTSSRRGFSTTSWTLFSCPR